MPCLQRNRETPADTVTLVLSRREADEYARDLAMGMGAMVQAAMTAIAPGEAQRLGESRRRLQRLYQRLTLNRWDWEAEEELTMLQRCRVLLLIVKPYLPLRLQTACGMMSGRLTRWLARCEAGGRDENQA